MTPKELLELKVSGKTTLRDVFYGAIEDGAFDVILHTDDEEQKFYELLAQKIIDAAKEVT